MKNWVESFWGSTAGELESQINRFCERLHCEPVSISAFEHHGNIYALVVMREGGEDNG